MTTMGVILLMQKKSARNLLTIAAVTLAIMAAYMTAPPSASASEPEKSVVFVVDTSGSMAGSRLTQAKEALNQSIETLDSSVAAGLRSYACNGSGGTLLEPVAVDNRDELKAAADSLVASGSTGTGDALRAALGDLPTSGERSVVLISDGQSNCGEPPCAVANEIRDSGIDITVHTVGFNAPTSAETELKCVADATGGLYFSATDAAGLAAAISDAVGSSCPRYLLVGVRGSGQDGKDSPDDAGPGGYDSTIGNFYYLMKQTPAWKNAPETDNVTEWPVEYTAESTDTLKPSKSQWAAVVGGGVGPAWAAADYRATKYALFMGSIDSGISAMVTYMTSSHQKCPDQKIVLAGYSQGAMAVQRSLNRLEDNGQDSVLDAVAAVVLIASGDKVPNTDAMVFGSPDAKAGEGIAYRIGAYRRDVPAQLRARTVNVCTKDDVICDISAYGLTHMGQNPHFQYEDSPEMVVAAGLAAGWAVEH